MKVALNGTAILALAGIAAVGVIVWRGSKLAGQAGDAITAAADKVNPANPDNVVNQAVTGIGKTVTGNENWTFGGWIYDMTHSDPLVMYGAPEGRQPASGELYDAMGNRIY